MTDERIELLVSNALRAGVLIALIVVLLGGVIHLAQHHTEPAGYSVFHRADRSLRTIGGIWRTASQGDGRGLIQLGLLILIATPLVRVAIAATGFALERDKLYAAISLIVLAILIYSVAHAR